MSLMNILEPITEEILSELRPGEWIWDNKRIRKTPGERIYEPIGFRKIHTLDPLMISSIHKGRNIGVHFEEGRFFRFRWDVLKEVKDEK